MSTLPHFPRKWFQLRHSKIRKKQKSALLKPSQHTFLSWRQLQNHFLRTLLRSNFDLNSLKHFASLSQKMVPTSPLKNLQITEKKNLLKCSHNPFLRSRYLQNHFIRRFLWPNSFERFGSLSQEMVSTSSLKNLQKTEKRPFQTLKTFVFELEVASKWFSKKLPVTKFRFKMFWTFCLTFPENGFNFLTAKISKRLKNDQFKRSQNLLLSSRWLQNHLPRRFL